MKLIVTGLVMLVTAMSRGRDDVPSDAGRGAGAQTQLMTTTVADVTGEDDASPVEVTAPDEPNVSRDRDPGELERVAAAGDWQVACELKSGSAVIFDRRSLRGFGATTLVRWAAPGDSRANQPVYTALVSCGEKTIEATWPGKRSETHAGTCGRHLVEAVCEAAGQRRRPVAPRASSGVN